MDILTLVVEVVIKAFKVIEIEKEIVIMKIEMVIVGVINKKNQKDLMQMR